jgi:erythromycin esterase-like protein
MQAIPVGVESPPALYAAQASLPLNAKEVLALVHTHLGDKTAAASIQQLSLEGRHLILIGENNHCAIEYRQLSAALQQQAITGQIALFKEGK